MKKNSLLMVFFSLTLCLSGSVLAQPVDTPTPTPTPIPPLVIELVQLEVGKPFILNVMLNQDITQPFDFYFFIDTPTGPYILYLNGKIKRGIIPLYWNVPGLNAPRSMTTAHSAFNIPASMKGETLTFHVAFSQAGKPPIAPYIILAATATAVVQ